MIGEPPSDNGAYQVILTLSFEFKRVFGLAKPVGIPKTVSTTLTYKLGRVTVVPSYETYEASMVTVY